MESNTHVQSIMQDVYDEVNAASKRAGTGLYKDTSDYSADLRAILRNHDVLSIVNQHSLSKLKCKQFDCNLGGFLLSIAVSVMDHELVRALVAKGADPNHGWSYVNGYSHEREMYASAKFLLSLGANPNSDVCNRPPLERAAEDARNLPTLKLLIEAGADPLRPNKDGRFPILYAWHNPEGARILREASASRLKARGSGVVIKRRKQRYDLGEARGILDLMHRIAHDNFRVSVLFVREATEGAVSLAMAEIVGAEEIERDLLKRPPRFAQQAQWILRLQDSDWTAVIRDTGHMGSGQTLVDFDRVTEEAPRLSRALDNALVVHVWQPTLREWRGDEVLWDQDYSPDSIEGSELQDEDDDVEYNRLVEARLRTLDQELAGRGIFLPPVFTETDGFFDRLALWGVRKSDLVFLERVVLQRELSLAKTEHSQEWQDEDAPTTPESDG